ncbi:unnamed protein product [Mesocestoides corti]|nr:unnamed protein product [Mesocestoides corti]
MSSAGVSTQGASLLYAVDWLLDRVRSMTTVMTSMAVNAYIDADAKRRKRKGREAEDAEDPLESSSFDHDSVV